MHKMKKVAAAVTAIAASAVVAAAPAQAISRVSATNCAQRNDYFSTSNTGGGRVCFANAGSISVAIYNVIIIQTGNNAGYFDYFRNGVNHNGIPFGKGQTVTYANPGVEVTF